MRKTGAHNQAIPSLSPRAATASSPTSVELWLIAHPDETASGPTYTGGSGLALRPRNAHAWGRNGKLVKLGMRDQVSVVSTQLPARPNVNLDAGVPVW